MQETVPGTCRSNLPLSLHNILKDQTELIKKNVHVVWDRGSMENKNEPVGVSILSDHVWKTFFL